MFISGFIDQIQFTAQIQLIYTAARFYGYRIKFRESDIRVAPDLDLFLF